MKTLRSTYLYADGHAVLLFKKQDKEAGEIEFVEIVERFTDASLSFTGRLVIGPYSGAVSHVIKLADSVRAKVPTLNDGSEGTRAKGIAFGTLEVRLGKHGSLYFHDMPGTISGPYTYQPDHVETFDAGCGRWGGYGVARIHRVKPAELAAIAA